MTRRRAAARPSVSPAWKTIGFEDLEWPDAFDDRYYDDDVDTRSVRPHTLRAAAVMVNSSAGRTAIAGTGHYHHHHHHHHLQPQPTVANLLHHHHYLHHYHHNSVYYRGRAHPQRRHNIHHHLADKTSYYHHNHHHHRGQSPSSPPPPSPSSSARPLYRRVYNFIRQAWTGVKFSLGQSSAHTLTAPTRAQPVTDQRGGDACAVSLNRGSAATSSVDYWPCLDSKTACDRRRRRPSDFLARFLALRSSFYRPRARVCVFYRVVTYAVGRRNDDHQISFDRSLIAAPLRTNSYIRCPCMS